MRPRSNLLTFWNIERIQKAYLLRHYLLSFVPLFSGWCSAFPLFTSPITWLAILFSGKCSNASNVSFVPSFTNPENREKKGYWKPLFQDDDSRSVCENEPYLVTTGYRVHGCTWTSSRFIEFKFHRTWKLRVWTHFEYKENEFWSLSLILATNCWSSFGSNISSISNFI